MYHVLYVEDDRNHTNLIKKALHREGIEMSEAFTAAQAEDLLSRIDYDLLLVDLVLPDKHGVELIKKLRYELSVWTPVIFYTGQPYETVQQYVENGLNCVSHVQKGQPLSLLVNKVKDFLKLEKGESRQTLNDLHTTAIELQRIIAEGEQKLESKVAIL